MAYEKYTWVDGELITAQKLNHIEEGITNAGGDCDCGYECTESTKELFAESVTAELNRDFYEGTFEYSQPIDADTILVEFDGTEYIVSKKAVDGVNVYGDEMDEGKTPDFARYPFLIMSNEDGFPTIPSLKAMSSGGMITTNMLVAQTSGKHTIAVSIYSESVEVSECFGKARGYYTKTVELINETVATVEEDGYNEAEIRKDIDIKGDTVTVIFDGIEYTCKVDKSEGHFGAPYNDDDTLNWSEYPFAVEYNHDGVYLMTETAGEHTIQIIDSYQVVTDNFVEAVNTVSVFNITETMGILDKTFAEIRDAFLAGKTCIINRPSRSSYLLVYKVDIDQYYIFTRDDCYEASDVNAYPAVLADSQ